MLKELLEIMKTGKKLVIHPCSLCQYPCGFLVRGDKLFYDTGCDCVNYGPVISMRSESDLNFYIESEGWQPKLRKFIDDNKPEAV